MWGSLGSPKLNEVFVVGVAITCDILIVCLCKTSSRVLFDCMLVLLLSHVSSYGVGIQDTLPSLFTLGVRI